MISTSSRLLLFLSLWLWSQTPLLAQQSCPDAGETCCNGFPNLCAMPVNEILFGMAHNAMSSPSAGFLLFANHLNDPIVESLDVGYRGL
jgi:hypothetical protein